MTTNRRISASRGAGFTLVEILVVIVIIGMLAGLTTSVLVSARRSVSNAIVSTQEAQLSIALDEYKNRYGEYPPDLSDKVAVERHIRKRWPRYKTVSYDDFVTAVANASEASSNGKHIWHIEPYLSSLVFWLGGLPNEDGVPSGFYLNPKAPLGPPARPERAKREKPLFAFEKKYLQKGYFAGSGSMTNTDGTEHKFYYGDEKHGPEYIPAYCQGGYPVIYFRPSVNSGYGKKVFFLGESESTSDVITRAYPYARTTDAAWYEENRFQLIHPGADGMFGPNEGGADPVYREHIPATQPKANVFLEDADNIVNFVESGTLESEYQE